MQSMISELRRRNVFRAAGAYTVGAWVVLQVADTIFPALGIPDGALTGLTLLAIVGFPLTVVVSWFYEWTPKGLMTTEAADAAGYVKPQGFGRLFDFVVIGLLAAAVGFLVYDRTRLQERVLITGDEPAIAVMSFIDTSTMKNQEYLAAGMAEELLNRLARTPSLRVAARTSSFYFRDRKATPMEIGDRLGVDALLEGAVRRFGGRVHVSAQLISAVDGLTLWSENFEGQPADIFSIQRSIIIAVLAKLLPALAAEDMPDDRDFTPASHNAYDLFLRGRYHWGRRQQSANPVGEIEAAVDYFARATTLDPGFARAWADMGVAQNALSDRNWGVLPESEVRPRAMEYLDRAIALAPGSSEVNAAVGLAFWGNDNERSLQHLDKAVAINPNLAGAHATRTRLLVLAHRYAEAFRSSEKAYELDPMNDKAVYFAFLSAVWSGRLEDAETFFDIDSEREIDPQDHMSRGMVAAAYGQVDRVVEFGRAFEMPKQISATPPAWARWRYTEAALTLGLVDEAREWAGEQYADIVLLAEGRADEALEHLDALMEKGQRGPQWARRQGWDMVISKVAILMALERFADAQALLGGGDFTAELMPLPQPHQNEHLSAEVSYVLMLREAGFAGEADAFLAEIKSGVETRVDEGVGMPSAHYELARVRVLEGRMEEALAALGTAVDKGWRKWYFDSDPVIDPLRSEPGFAAIATRYRADIERMRSLVMANAADSAE